MRELFEAIIKDDILEFEKIVKDSNNLKVCFGRFPILTICYLYNCKKIITKYEKDLLKITNFEICSEPLELYKKLFSVAKKEARIYAGKDVRISPIEMLYILGKMTSVEEIYAYYSENAVVVENLKMLEKIRSQKQLILDKNKINTIAPKLSKKKKKICIVAVATFMTMILISSLFCGLIINMGIGTEKFPIKVGNSQQLNACIKNGVNTIVLGKDFEIENYGLNEFAGVIEGSGKTITINKIDRPIFNEFKGHLRNLKIVFNLEEQLVISDVFGFCEINSGTIENVEIVVNANFVVNGNEQELGIAFIAKDNFGTIKNICVKGNVHAVGNGECDSMFASICINNKNIVQEISYEANTTSINCDIAGVCINNEVEGKILNSDVKGSLTQSVTKGNWNPNIGGVCLYNDGQIEETNSTVAIEVKTSDIKADVKPSIIVGGIVANNFSIIKRCRFAGEIISNSYNENIYIGGISSIDSSRIVENTDLYVESYINNCISEATININTQNPSTLIVIGGVSAIEEAIIYRCCVNLDLVFNFEPDSNSIIIVGGICGNITNEIYYAAVYGKDLIYQNYYVLKENIELSVGRVNAIDFGATAFTTYEELIKAEAYWS